MTIQKNLIKVEPTMNKPTMYKLTMKWGVKVL